MPTKRFFELSADKQWLIINAAIDEFARCGYTNASTNRIVAACGISKGSLFKYFDSKEELYFFLLDTVMGEMLRDMESGLGALSTELFQRIIDYSCLEIAWYIQNPVKGRLVIGAAAETDSAIQRKTAERYGITGDNIYYSLLDGIDESALGQSKEKTADMLKWVLEGFNRQFLARADIGTAPLEQLREEYLRELSECIKILKKGFLKG